jgi:hypothetical protein
MAHLRQNDEFPSFSNGNDGAPCSSNVLSSSSCGAIAVSVAQAFALGVRKRHALKSLLSGRIRFPEDIP